MLGNTPATFGFVAGFEMTPATTVAVWRRGKYSFCGHLDCASMEARSKLHGLLACVLLLSRLTFVEIPELCLHVLQVWVSKEGADGLEQTLLAVS